MSEILCRRAAVLSDIHSNYHALAACIKDALAQGADGFIFLGDYVSDLADPRACMDLVYDLCTRHPAACLRGNRERYMLEHRQGLADFRRGSKTGSLLYTYEQLRTQDLDFFARLPCSDRIRINGIPFEIAHAARDDDRCYFEADERAMPVLAQMTCAHMLTGHSHRQFILQRDGRTIINPGSVGVPMEQGPMAQYALLIFDGDMHCELRRVAYDLRATVRRQFESGLAEYAPHWAVSILYDVLTGREYTMPLLSRVQQAGEGAVYDEACWHAAALEMGMRLTESEIIEVFGL